MVMQREKAAKEQNPTLSFLKEFTHCLTHAFSRCTIHTRTDAPALGTLPDLAPSHHQDVHLFPLSFPSINWNMF